MRKKLLGTAAALAVAALTVVGLTTQTEGSTDPLAGSTVKVVRVGGGHGSGVHIGNGYIVTAAHVMRGAKGATIKTSDGDMVDVADVLWINDKYDVALLKVDPEGLAESNLSCRPVLAGTPVVARGNPSAIEFVDMRGFIAGAPREQGPWASVYVTDITIIGGMSGGGVFDEHGNVIGIAVGGMLTRVAMGAPPSITGVTLVVPSPVICNLLARG